MLRSRGASVGHVALADRDPAVGHLLEPGDHRRASTCRTRRADEDHELAVVDLERDGVEGPDPVR